MNDRDLEARVRADLQAAAQRPVPEALARRAVMVAQATRRPARQRWWPPAVGLAAALGAVIVVAIVASALPSRSSPAASMLSSSTPATSPLASGDALFGGASARPTSGTSAVPTPLPAGPDIESGGMVNALNGWAVTSSRLWVTADGGKTWRDATPPGGLASPSAELLLGVAFADAQHGWVALNEAFVSASDPSYGRVDIWRTSDGGRTWAKTQLPRARFAAFGDIMPPVQFDVLDATHAFAFQSGNLAKGRNDSDLFWTGDGGQSWSPDRPTGTGNVGIEGSVAFATALDGVVVNTPRGTGISVTHDGGGTWNDAALALPAGSEGAQLFFGQPAYFDGRSGLVTVDIQHDTSSIARVFRTSDAGSSWSPASAIPAGVSAISFLDPDGWIALTATEVLRTTDGGRTWARASAVGLPGAPGSLRMTDAQHGSVLVSMNVCLTFKSNCSNRTGLYSTEDGGSTWTQLWPR
ncbi:MAG TPA: YCF48-related protein [Candidatus Limnocylindrales bacterium]